MKCIFTCVCNLHVCSHLCRRGRAPERCPHHVGWVSPGAGTSGHRRGSLSFLFCTFFTVYVILCNSNMCMYYCSVKNSGSPPPRERQAPRAGAEVSEDQPGLPHPCVSGRGAQRAAAGARSGLPGCASPASAP